MRTQFTNTSENNKTLSTSIQSGMLWHYDKGLIRDDNEERQIEKLLEEAYEIQEAAFENGNEHFKEELGDAIMVLINLCERRHCTMAECLAIAVKKVYARKGKTIGGTFIKEEDL